MDETLNIPDHDYNDESIVHLEDLEHIRLRPGMYIGRLGEMYLIAAEAAAKAGDNAAAQQYLYDLNKTRDDAYEKSDKTGADLIDEIYTYRRIELWGEGHRFLDLKRLNMPLDRTGANHVPAVASVMEIPADDIRWKFAIPQDEIDANDLIDPNVNK